MGRAARAGRPAQAARYLRMELAAGAGALRRLQAEAAAFPAAEVEAGQEAQGDFQASPRMRAEAVATEPESFPVA